MKVIDPAKYRRIYEDVMKKLDKLENEFLPQVIFILLCLSKIVTLAELFLRVDFDHLMNEQYIK